MKKIIYKIAGVCLCLIVCLLTACLKNDFPYPTVKLYITDMTVEGQVGNAVISNDERKVTLQLNETVNPKKVKIHSLEVTEGGKASIEPESIVDLSQPLNITLSLYQDYIWTVVAEQTIERVFTVNGQIGQAYFYPEEREAAVNIPRTQGLKSIQLTALKLGPEGSTQNGTTALPELQWENKGAFATAKVQVKYSDFIDEEWTLYVNLTDINVGVNSVDAWTNVAWVNGFGRQGAENGCEYKKDGEQDWIRVSNSDITHEGGNFKARLIHLDAATTYVCRAYSGEEYGEETKFTTGIAATVPNLGFDEWHKEGKVICPWKEGGISYWDTGNWGSTTLSANDNITQPTSDVWSGAPQGGQAAMLGSKFVGLGSFGKFAAGNLFLGEYKETDGTNGILGFGREFTARPTKLKGYFKYTSSIIKYADKAHEDLKGKQDTCIIWVSLGDWDEPVEIRTNPQNSKYFTKTDPHIIAYGEMNCSETMSEYREFEIELDYRDTDRVPKYLLIVCSASKYGDYFTGGAGSTMWVDEFSLEYDYDQ